LRIGLIDWMLPKTKDYKLKLQLAIG